MTNACIVTCAFREPYVTHSNRQLEVIRAELPDIEVIRFVNELPYSEGIVTEDIVNRFQKSLYGFKPHAIQKAIDKGYKLVAWFDPSVSPVTSIKEMFDELEQTDMLVVKGEHHIKDMTSDKAFKWFLHPEKKYININHIGGTFYGFNFNHQPVMATFNLWKRAEEQGIFGDQQEFMNGHWADESCMALAMNLSGIEQKASKVFGYRNQKEMAL